MLLAKCAQYQQLDCNISHDWYLPDALRSTKQLRLSILSNDTNMLAVAMLELAVYSPIAFNERVTFCLQPPGHCLVRVHLLHCMRVRLRNGYTWAYAQIMQHTYTHKAVTQRVEAKKLISRRRQSKYSDPESGTVPLYHGRSQMWSSNRVRWWATLYLKKSRLL